MPQANLEQTLDAMKEAQASAIQNQTLTKSFTQPSNAITGLQAYNLEGPSKKFIPIQTPLRNMIPRVTGGFAIQANWKVITNINVQNQRAGVGEGQRGGKIQHESAEYFAAFRGFGLENDVTFEADYAAKNFEDVKALAVSQTLEATMIQEERLILGGNTSLALGQTATPSLAAVGTGGTLTAASKSVICIALGLQAYLDVVGMNNGGIGQIFDPSYSQVPGQINRTNADGSSSTFGGGSARKSSAATVTVVDGGSITATVLPTAGAVGYAWYMGAAGSEKLVAVTAINSVIIKEEAQTNAQLASSIIDQDNSTSIYDFDGLLVQAFKPNSKAYLKVMPTGTAGIGTKLSSDGTGGVVEINEALYAFYTRYRLSPDVIYVSAQELQDITSLIIGNNGAPLLQLTVDVNDPSSIVAGKVVGSYLNKITNQKVDIRVHPNMPTGTIFFFTRKLPYQLSNVTNAVQMQMRQDYYQIEWPLRTRKYEYGVYADGVLQHYAPFSMGVITNIARQ